MEKKLGFGCWEKLQASGSAPSVRFGHSTAVVGDVLYVFGGGSYSGGEETVYHNDLFTLDCKYSKQREFLPALQLYKAANLGLKLRSYLCGVQVRN